MTTEHDPRERLHLKRLLAITITRIIHTKPAGYVGALSIRLERTRNSKLKITYVETCEKSLLTPPVWDLISRVSTRRVPGRF